MLTRQSCITDHVVQPKPQATENLIGAPRPIIRSTADLAQLIEWTRQNDLARSNRDPRAAQTHDIYSGSR
jgi:hypothetical protein